MSAAAAAKPWWQRILIRIGIAVLGLVVVGAVSTWWTKHNASKELDKYAIGDCLVLTKSGIGVEDSAVECSEDPSYTVASRQDAGSGCPNDNYVTYEVTVRGDTVSKLCLVENLVVDHCYESELVSNVTKLVDCKSSMVGNQFKVLSRQDSSDGACAEEAVVVSYPDPAPGRTYCVGPPE